MEEVDEIIVHSLRSIGFQLDDEVKSIKQLKTDDVANAVLALVKAIDPSQPFPRSLPRQMSQKVNICSEVAQYIKGLGYKGDLGYHELVYPNEATTRQILRFLMNELPEPEGENDSQALQDPVTAFNKSIKAELQAAMKEVWAPTPVRRQNYAEVYRLTTVPLRSAYIPGPKSGRNAGLEAYIRDHLPFITQQPNQRQDVVPSILEHNLSAYAEEKEREEEWSKIGVDSGVNPFEYKRRKQDGINKAMAEALRDSVGAASFKVPESLADILAALETTGPNKNTKFGREVAIRDKQETGPKESDEELEKRRTSEIEELDALLARCKAEVEKYEKAIATFIANIRQTEADMLTEDAKKKELQDKYVVMKKTFDLLPDAENNIKQLQQISAASAQRLLELANEWEKHRVPLLDEYRELRDKNRNKKDECAPKLEEIKKMRLQMRTLADDIKKKNETYKELLEYYKNLPKEVSRAVYTRRILDIVKNVKKQKVEINKVLIDMRNLMKEITLISDTLARSYAVTDNQMFADAKKDETSKMAYKDLVAMDTSFKKLVQMLEETGDTRNGIMELEIKIEQLKGRVDSLNMERLEKDLALMKGENAKLVKQIKSARLNKIVE